MSEQLHKHNLQDRTHMIYRMGNISDIDMSKEENQAMRFNMAVNLLKSSEVQKELEDLLKENIKSEDDQIAFLDKAQGFIDAVSIVRDAPVEGEKRDVLLKSSLDMLRRLHKKYSSSSVYDEDQDVFAEDLQEDIEKLEHMLA